MSDGLFEPIEQLAEKVGEDLTDVAFNPRPGGFMDRWQREKAAKEADAEERKNESERVENPAYKAVKTTQESPEVVSMTTVNIPAGGTAMVLPSSPYRYRATILASAAVILAKDSGAALGQQGFALPMNVTLIMQHRAQVWAYAAEAATVSVISEIYAPE